MEDRLAAAVREDAVRNGDVVVDVQVQASAETLGKADRAAASTQNTGESGLLALPAENLAHEDAPDGRERSVVFREKQPELEWNAQHPLAERNVWKDAIDEVSGGSTHASRVARGANSPPLAREGDEELFATLPAASPEEAMRVDAACEVGVQLSLDVLR
jgi:hypothetical protein